jgi:hypothetical protein
MPRYVFRQKSGKANRPVTELAERASKLGGKVLSQTSSMLYLEGSDEMYETLSANSPDYVSSHEVRRALPKPPRVAVRRRSKAA